MFKILLLALLSFSANAGNKLITFTPSNPTPDVAPFTCDATQSGYFFTVSMYNTPSSCTVQNVFPTYGSLTAGKVGTMAAYGMKAPAGVTFSLKAFNLKYATTLKGYPGVYINTVDSLGNSRSYSVKLNALGAYDVSGLSLDNLTEVYIQARTAARLELTNISIVDSQ
ncbi:hypothetical protein [Methylomonas sp. UP202]|uniref:hypothetical protein n=1 Tax=Methylomonas sp. UP202 TaxID=3040943 RepID=UPI00143CAA45|nr:hypothetical protein [Methylomonas sp. UP202]NJA04770.1 hypothetical protein [Methylococcaceae bacterium WWC4]WGS87880.1 hypothetical protein QC632_08990 [Methylomonas sp. UP202]